MPLTLINMSFFKLMPRLFLSIASFGDKIILNLGMIANVQKCFLPQPHVFCWQRTACAVDFASGSVRKLLEGGRGRTTLQMGVAPRGVFDTKMTGVHLPPQCIKLKFSIQLSIKYRLSRCGPVTIYETLTEILIGLKFQSFWQMYRNPAFDYFTSSIRCG